MIGAGFNAFVVVGYADRRLTMQKRDLEDCLSYDFFTMLGAEISELFAADCALSEKYTQGLTRVPGKYCRAVTDFNEVE